MFALFTDFGWEGPYVGQMKAQLVSCLPQKAVVDLQHDAPKHDPVRSAYLLAAYSGSFPSGTIFVCVVDPGVGSLRRCIAVEARQRWYVGPDNGLLSVVARQDPQATCLSLPMPPGVSASFHGRDVFAPAAAAIAQDRHATWASLAVSGLNRYPLPDDLPEVIYVDHFGNLVTGLRDDSTGDCRRLGVGEAVLEKASTFSDVPPHQLFWYRNSSGLVEIAANGQRADDMLGIAVGAKVTLIPGPNTEHGR